MKQALHDHSAERAYLAAAIVDLDVLEKHALKPGEMHHPAHALILEAMQGLLDEGQPAGTLAVKSQLERLGKLKAVGGEEGLLAATCDASFTAPSEARKRLRRLAALRDTRERLVGAVAACDEGRLSDAMDLVHGLADEVRSSEERRVYSAHEIAVEAVRHMGALSDEQGSSLVRTGIEPLDAVIGGLEPGDLLTVGAQTNVGKSWVALISALKSARMNHRPGIISLEDPKHIWGSRLVSLLGSVGSHQLRTRQLSRNDFEEVARALEAAKGIGLEVAIENGADVFGVIDAMRRLVREHACDWLVIDYAQCLFGVEEKSEHLALKRMFTMIKSTADRLGVPVMLMSQIKRGDNPDREPCKYDLKEGGDLEIKSEYVVMLWRTKDEPNRLHAKLDKSKVGGNGRQWAWRQLARGESEGKSSGTLVLEDQSPSGYED